ncbi:apoptotic chromatin condensation inducer in the nucleus isoform X2 [Carica papaya]|nr:apoptotic chromatin condensation inducer in the nucleus isoform X2 [Carica papaya]
MENAQMGNAENKKLEVENAEREKSGKGTPKRKNADKADNGFSTDPQPVTGVKDTETVIIADETVKEVRLGSNKNKRVDDDRLQVDINDPVNCSAEEKCEERDMIGDVNTARMEGVSDVQAAHVETGIVIVESVSSEVACGQDMQNSGAMDEKGNSSIQQENKDSKPKLETGSLTAQLTDDVHETSASSNQVSEVSPVLGFQVKSDSISTDSVSINKKIELKDNIIADNVKIEQDVVRPEMVQPSSSSVVPVSGELHPMDVEEPLEKKASVEEKDDENITNADASKKNDSADIGYSEKLNLDRSSGDDSMEDDVLESKQIDSKYNSDEVGNRSEKSKMLVVKDESPVDVVGDDLSTAKTVMPDENKTVPSVPAEKRKLHDQETVGNNEPLKRQRRWNSENIKVPELHGADVTPTITPKGNFQSTSLKRSFSKLDSSANEDAPKERVVPISQKTPTNSLRIDRFLRPFTLKAVQELLGKTGTATSFWMDHIKTHCYVTYSSVEEAVETRNAVYNLQWPPNGGRLLVAEFVDPQDVKLRLEAPPTPTTPVNSGSTATAQTTLQPQPSPRQQVSRQQLPPPSALPPPPPLSNPLPVRERLPLPPPPPLPEKQDPPIVTLDDLFRKTKATPRIYYLPLSEDQVAAKLASRGKNMKQ